MRDDVLAFETGYRPPRQLQSLTAVFDELKCGLFARSADRRIVAVNRRLLDWLGYEKEELLGEDVVKLAPPELVDLWEEELADVEAGLDNRPMIVAVLRKDGSTFPVVTLPHRFVASDGTFLGAFAVVLDLGSIQTARRYGESPGDLRGKLQRIALELQSISMAAEMPSGGRLPLEHPRLAALTPREKEVLAELVGGHRVAAIAERLFISEHTVRNHLKSIYSKLYVGSLSQLIELVRNLGEE